MISDALINELKMFLPLLKQKVICRKFELEER